MTLDYRPIQRAISFAINQVGRDAADTLTRAARMTVIGGKGVKGAIQRTPRADRSKIKSLDDKIIAAAVAEKLRKKGKLKGVSGKQFKAYCRYEKQRRLRSIGYTAGPGWHEAAVSVGGRGVRVQKGFGKSEARRGSGKKATPNHLVAEIVNTAPAAEKIGLIALQEGLNDAARDMEEHGQRKIAKTLGMVSA